VDNRPVTRNGMLIVGFDLERNAWLCQVPDHAELVGWPAVFDYLDRQGHRVVSSCVDYYDARVATGITPSSPTSLDARIYRLFVVRED
jgi:hypothetical protein